MRFTGPNIDTLTLQGKAEAIYFDDDVPGLGIRLRAGGSKNWIFQYRVGKKQRRLSLGKVSAIPLASARKTAGELYAKRTLGQDPQAAKEAATAAAGNTLEAAIEQFTKARSRDWRPRTREQMEFLLQRCAKKLHPLPVASITQSDIARLLTDLEDERGPATCNRTRSALSGLFSWYRSEGNELPRGNPVVDTRVRKEKSDDDDRRILKDDELVRVWNAAGDGSYGGVIKLMMLTGCRSREIGDLAYNEITDTTIEIPGARTKNKRAHSIPISTAIRTVLDKFPPNGWPFLFGRRRGFSDWDKSKQALDKRVGGMPHWTTHALRRTLSTGMHELGVAPHIVEACINHISGYKGGVAGTYNKAKYEPQKRAALELWAEHLMALVEGRTATVVPLQRRV